MKNAAVLIFLVCAGLASAGFFANAQTPGGSQSRSVLDGVYTEAQGSRGKAIYQEECARCHSETLLGGEGSPELAGDAFLERWKGQTAGDLFERIRSSMPSDSPGRLSRQQYADVLAYMFKANHFPAGQTELARETDTLKQIRIEISR
jgi:mono/diheme cytochrome c family protein